MQPVRNSTQRGAQPTPANEPVVIPGSISSDSLREAAGDVGRFLAHTVPFVSTTAAVGYTGVSILSTTPEAFPFTGLLLFVAPLGAGALAARAMHDLTGHYKRLGVAYPALRSLGDTLTRIVAPTVLPALALCAVDAPGLGFLAALVGGTTAIFFEGKRQEALSNLNIERRR